MNEIRAFGDLFGASMHSDLPRVSGPNAQKPLERGHRQPEFMFLTHDDGLSAADKACAFLQSLRIPEGPKAGETLSLAPFQRQFVEGSLAPETQVAVLSIGRGNAKSALSAGIALGELLGAWDPQPRREIVIAARTRDQGRIAFNFAESFCEGLPLELRRRLIFRKNPRLEIEFEGDGGGHMLKVIAADGKSALGSAPCLVLMDERGHWPLDQGNDLEAALLSGLGKRGGRALIISTSAADDAHPFSQWIDHPQLGTYVQEHRPSPGLPADDRASLLVANPGSAHGIGAGLDWLEHTAKVSIARGGSSLQTFRLYNRNERVSGDSVELLLTPDEWLACETDTLPPREGPLVIGIDLGGSSSMSAAAFYWPDTGRLEAFGTFPGKPSLLDRGQRDGVSGRYVEMSDRGELTTLGDATVPVAPWMGQVMARVADQQVAAICADRYKMAEIGEAIARAGIRAPVVWRGQGFRDGGEDCERFRRACFEGKVIVAPSLLLRSAFADALTKRDDANNLKLTKARSLGRIDAASATVLAVAEGARMKARPVRQARAVWL